MASQTRQPAQTDDPFDFSSSLLNLEEDFYQQGYAQGVSDGVKAGRTEGRQLGLENGFQKFVQSGRLHGRAIVWANRLPSKQGVRGEYLSSSSQSRTQSHSQPQSTTKEEGKEGKEVKEASQCQTLSSTVDNLKLADSAPQQNKEQLKLLPNNTRLEKHITTLFALVETDTLAKDNTDEAVNDFDDRLKRAQGKAKIVERMVGEVSTERKKVAVSSAVTSPGGESSGTGTGAGAGAGTPIAGVDLGRIGNEV